MELCTRLNTIVSFSLHSHPQLDVLDEICGDKTSRTGVRFFEGQLLLAVVTRLRLRQ